MKKKIEQPILTVRHMHVKDVIATSDGSIRVANTGTADDYDSEDGGFRI